MKRYSIKSAVIVASSILSSAPLFAQNLGVVRTAQAPAVIKALLPISVSIGQGLLAPAQEAAPAESVVLALAPEIGAAQPEPVAVPADRDQQSAMTALSQAVKTGAPGAQTFDKAGEKPKGDVDAGGRFLTGAEVRILHEGVDALKKESGEMWRKGTQRGFDLGVANGLRGAALALSIQNFGTGDTKFWTHHYAMRRDMGQTIAISLRNTAKLVYNQTLRQELEHIADDLMIDHAEPGDDAYWYKIVRFEQDVIFKKAGARLLKLSDLL